MSDHCQCRRNFLLSLGKSITVVTLVPSVFESCSPTTTDTTANGSSGTPLTLDLTENAYAPLVSVGGAIKIPDPNDSTRPIIIIRTSETVITAFSSRCPHQGCEVSLPSDNGTVACPCHDSIFDASGNRISGPATSGLRQYDATLDGTIITLQV